MFTQASILDEIIQSKLDPRHLDRPSDFIDCVRLLGDIIDSYPYEQQVIFLSKLYQRVSPYTVRNHQRIFTDEVKRNSLKQRTENRCILFLLLATFDSF